MLHRLQLLVAQRSCDAMGSFAGRVIDVIAEHVDARVGDWWETNWRKGSDAVLMGPKKKRRVDQHIREWCVAEALTSKEQKSVGAALRSVGQFGAKQPYAFRDDMLAAMRCDAHMDFAESQVLSLAWDGARFGNPAREFVLASLSDLAKNKHYVLPPQDSGSQYIHSRSLWLVDIALLLTLLYFYIALL